MLHRGVSRLSGRHVLNAHLFTRGVTSRYGASVHERSRAGRSAAGFNWQRSFSDVAPDEQPRESMDYDVVIVGAGPAGLSAAIRLKQLAKQKDKDISVCVVEKGAAVGAHILSGNVFDPKALNELIPDWKAKDAPVKTKVTHDRTYFLTKKHAIPLPVPPDLHNDGNYIISLSHLVRWLGQQAEELGVEIYTGISASEVLYEDDKVRGIATRDVGIGKDGQPKPTFARGMELKGKQTLFAEGCRGSLSELVMKKFDLRSNADPQQYGIGLKEVWEVEPSKLKSGFVMHTTGWPINDGKTYAGSFVYHMDPNMILIGYVVGLDYENPYLNPYEEFQRFKTHPHIRPHIEGGKCIAYGARAINEGGFQAIPKLTFPGGALIGCSAGFLNVPRIKGSHTAIKSGMLAAEAIGEAVLDKGVDVTAQDVSSYEQRLKNSWVYEELKQVRNVHPGFKWGIIPGVINFALESFILKGREPWTLHAKLEDHEHTKPAAKSMPIKYPKPDGVLTFDILTNVARTGTNHEEEQPSHLKIKPELADVPVKTSYQVYAAPETRFCPAKVYEYVTDEGGKNPKLVINAQNCIHCKTCDIKTPKKYIQWTVPEGGGGPAYEVM